jgi:STAM-binding protein
LNLDKIKTHPGYSNCDKNELSIVKDQLKTIAFPRAEKLKQYIKDVFAHEAKEYQKQIEEEEKLKELAKKTSQTTESTTRQNENNLLDLNDLKHKYDLENEAELKQLQEKELNALMNSMKLDDDEYKNKLNRDASDDESHVLRGGQKPIVDRSLKPKNASDQNSYNLRTIMVPYDLTKKFLDVAEANTKRNIETCGILAGKLVNYLSTIIIYIFLLAYFFSNRAIINLFLVIVLYQSKKGPVTHVIQNKNTNYLM